MLLALELLASLRSTGRLDALTRFAENLRVVRKARGHTQASLGQASGLHFTEISRLERGVREPRLSTMVRLADALEVPLEVLVAGIGSADGPPLPADIERRSDPGHA